MDVIQRIVGLGAAGNARPLAPERRRQVEAAADLETALRASVGGEVRFDNGSRGVYATDHSIYRHVPIGVVIPRDADDVRATVAACQARSWDVSGDVCMAD